MRQQFVKVLSGVGFGGTTQFSGPCDGSGTVTFGLFQYPMALPGIIRSLVVYSGATRSAPLSITLLKNTVPTALQTSLGTGATIATDATDDVSFSAGDTLYYKLVGPTTFFPGYEIGITEEFEATANLYGIGASFGNVNAGAGLVGGALGNGFWSAYAGNDGATYSICAIPGAVTTLCLKRYTTPAGGAWIGHIRLNGVIQDGSGGTVDTTCLLDDAAGTFATASFNLPCVPTDHVVVVVERQTTAAPFAVNGQVGAGIAFTPTTPGQYMFCGGSNDSVATPIPGWKWNQSIQEGPLIAMHTGSVGLRGLAVTGLYVERTGPPGAGESYTQTVLRNAALTPVSVPISGAIASSGSVIATEVYVAGDLITIQLDATAGAAGVPKFYWGMAAEEFVPPPGCPGVIDVPRVDGLPYVPPDVDPCAGTGERGAPRTGA